jgi:hypothetical protein
MGGHTGAARLWRLQRPHFQVRCLEHLMLNLRKLWHVAHVATVAGPAVQVLVYSSNLQCGSQAVLFGLHERAIVGRHRKLRGFVGCNDVIFRCSAWYIVSAQAPVCFASCYACCCRSTSSCGCNGVIIIWVIRVTDFAFGLNGSCAALEAATTSFSGALPGTSAQAPTYFLACCACCYSGRASS